MVAPVGNRFWEARAKHGRGKIFETPNDLWVAACEYFVWVDDNPLIEYKVTQYQGEVVTMPVPKLRAMTTEGLQLFLDISHQTWQDYKARQDFIEVTTKIEKVIYNQKFTGAAGDQLNANIIARDLGLKDRQEITAKVAVTADELSDDELAAMLNGEK